MYTGRRAQRLSTGGRQMRRQYTSQAIVPGRQDATQPQANVPCADGVPDTPRTHARTWTSDVAR